MTRWDTCPDKVIFWVRHITAFGLQACRPRASVPPQPHRARDCPPARCQVCVGTPMNRGYSGRHRSTLQGAPVGEPFHEGVKAEDGHRQNPLVSTTQRGHGPSNLDKGISAPLVWAQMGNSPAPHIRAKGSISTAQRRLLLDLLRDTPGHIDARDLYRLANEKGQRVSLATVYRTLSFFTDLGIVEERHLDRTRCYYEMKPTTDHYHLVCEGCGQVFDFENPLVNQLAEEVGDTVGFEVERAVLYLEGLCKGCLDKAAGQGERNDGQPTAGPSGGHTPAQARKVKRHRGGPKVYRSHDR